MIYTIIKTGSDNHEMCGRVSSCFDLLSTDNMETALNTMVDWIYKSLCDRSPILNPEDYEYYPETEVILLVDGLGWNDICDDDFIGNKREALRQNMYTNAERTAKDFFEKEVEKKEENIKISQEKKKNIEEYKERVELERLKRKYEPNTSSPYTSKPQAFWSL